MKICQIIYTLQSGGAETLAAELALTLQRKGHSVVVVLLNRIAANVYEQQKQAELQAAGVRILTLDRQAKSMVSQGLTIVKLTRIFRRERFDVIHSHLVLADIFAYAANLFSGRRAVQISTLHSMKLLSPKGLLGKLWYGCQRRIHTVFCSQAVYDKNAMNFKAGGICIPNGVSRRPGDAGVARRFLADRNIDAAGRVVLLSVGSLVEAKNRDVMMAGMKELAGAHPELLLVICGEGLLRTHYEELIEREKLTEHVRLTGVCECVQDMYELADAFVSTSAYEGLPMAVLEALLHGCDCLLSPIPPHQSLNVGLDNIIMLEANTAAGFAGAVEAWYAAGRPGRKKSASAADSAALKPYTIDTCTEKYLELYRQSMKKCL